jgi:hypothetical protein
MIAAAVTVALSAVFVGTVAQPGATAIEYGLSAPAVMQPYPTAVEYA